MDNRKGGKRNKVVMDNNRAIPSNRTRNRNLLLVNINNRSRLCNSRLSKQCKLELNQPQLVNRCV